MARQENIKASNVQCHDGLLTPYEPPPRPELVLRTAEESVNECVRSCLDLLTRHGLLKTHSASPRKAGP
jgi:adenylylsulfate kinase-like enzyme